MPRAQIRPFSRAARDQLAGLVNAHIGAVLPGVSVSVNTVLSQLEREPDEYTVDPWAVDRTARVAVVRDRLVAAAHLVRYGTESRVGGDYRDAGEIRWLVFIPGAEEAADALAATCLEVLDGWGVTRRCADGALPAPAGYGVPACWPHVRAALARAGFTPDGQTEMILLADVADLPAGGPASIDGLSLRRELGGYGTRFSAVLDERVVGLYEVTADLTAGGTRSRLAGWGDVGNLPVDAGLARAYPRAARLAVRVSVSSAPLSGFSADASEVEDRTGGAQVAGVRPPKRVGDHARFQQFQTVEEADQFGAASDHHLGPAALVPHLHARTDLLSVDLRGGMGDRHVAPGGQGLDQLVDHGMCVGVVNDEVEDTQEHQRDRLTEVQRPCRLAQDHVRFAQVGLYVVGDTFGGAGE